MKLGQSVQSLLYEFQEFNIRFKSWGLNNDLHLVEACESRHVGYSFYFRAKYILEIKINFWPSNSSVSAFENCVKCLTRNKNFRYDTSILFTVFDVPSFDFGKVNFRIPFSYLASMLLSFESSGNVKERLNELKEYSLLE